LVLFSSSLSQIKEQHFFFEDETFTTSISTHFCQKEEKKNKIIRVLWIGINDGNQQQQQLKRPRQKKKKKKETNQFFFSDQPLEIYINEGQKLTLDGLQQYFVNLKENEKNAKLVQLLDELQFNQVIVFVKNVQRAKALNQLLCEQNFPSHCIHSMMDQKTRYLFFSFFLLFDFYLKYFFIPFKKNRYL
jgi:hypothetical protein